MHGFGGLGPPSSLKTLTLVARHLVLDLRPELLLRASMICKTHMCHLVGILLHRLHVTRLSDRLSVKIAGLFKLLISAHLGVAVGERNLLLRLVLTRPVILLILLVIVRQHVPLLMLAHFQAPKL